MDFCVVQTRKTKKSKPILSIVPAKWVKDGQVSWPPNNFISLSTDANSDPKISWVKQNCKVVGRAKTYREGEDVVSRLEQITDSEDAVQQTVTRGRPPKKKSKFEVKTYSLTPPQKQSKEHPVDKFAMIAEKQLPNSYVEPAPKSGNLEQHPAAIVETSAPVLNEQVNCLDSPSPALDPCAPSIQLALQQQPEMPSPSHEPEVTIATVTPTADRSPLREPEVTIVTVTPTADRSPSHESDIAVPAATPNADTEQTVQLDQSVVPDATTMFNPELPVNIVNDSNGKQYISLGYDCFEIVSGETSGGTPTVTNQEPHENDIKNELAEIRSGMIRMEQQHFEIREQMLHLKGMMEKVLQFSANFNRMLEAKNPTNTEKKREPERFPDIEALFPVASESNLLILEGMLKTKETEDRCFRYFDCQYSLTGKREGAPFFKTVLRKMIVPTILSPFSWKGNSRKNAEVPNIPNRSFRTTFPQFVSFVQRVVCAADIAHTAEANDVCFSQFLRQKNLEIQRFLGGHQNQRASCSRKRKVVAESSDSEVVHPDTANLADRFSDED